MGFFLFPDCVYKNSYTVDYQALWDRGIRYLLFDIDNTLVGHGEPVDERARELIERLRSMGFTPVCVSNNREKRVKTFCEPVGLPYVYKAGKPGAGGYERAMGLLGADISSTAFIGDQLFTDIWGAKALGLYSVLVRPLYPAEEIQIVIKRWLEAPVLFVFRLLHPDRIFS